MPEVNVSMASKSARAGLVVASIAIAGGVPRLHAQDLAPRAYTVTPRGVPSGFCSTAATAAAL